MTDFNTRLASDWAEDYLPSRSLVTSLADSDEIFTSAGNITWENVLKGIYGNVLSISQAGGVPNDPDVDHADLIHEIRDYLYAKEGGAIIVDGHYYHSGISLDKEAVCLAGFGREASRLVGHADIGSNDHVSVSGSFVTIRDLSIYAVAEGLGDDGIVTTASRFQAKNVLVQSVGGTGIIIGESGIAHAAQLSDIFVHATGVGGIEIGSSGFDSQFENVWIGEVITGAGLHLGAGACRFTNLHVWGTVAGNGIQVRSVLNHFTNVYSETNSVDGIDVFNASRNFFTSVDVWANGNHGLHISGTSDGNQVSNLIARRNGVSGTGYGVYVAAGTANKFANVECYDDQETKTQDIGFSVAASATDTMIVNLEARDSLASTGDGYADAGTNTMLSNSVTS